jgi:hypothetical protein
MAYILLFAGDMRHTFLTGTHGNKRKRDGFKGLEFNKKGKMSTVRKSL